MFQVFIFFFPRFVVKVVFFFFFNLSVSYNARLLDNVILYFYFYFFTGECSLAYSTLFTLSVFYLASNHDYELLKVQHYSR